MGLLDDAIRDHLDLKRRRGADPAEIERAEREALGPVRREPIGSEEGAQTAHEGVESPATAADATVLHPAVEEYGPGERFDEPDEDDELGDEEEWDDDEYEDEPEEARGHPEDAAHRHPPAPSGDPSDSPRPSADPDAGLGETVSYDLSEADIEHPGQGGEDVLEETPEFLQDTPDHDRLWFEQRPPKDFDFDE